MSTFQLCRTLRRICVAGIVLTWLGWFVCRSFTLHGSAGVVYEYYNQGDRRQNEISVDEQEVVNRIAYSTAIRFVLLSALFVALPATVIFTTVIVVCSVNKDRT